MMQVLQDNGLISDNVFGFIQGGAPEWAADLACTTQWHARKTGKSSFQVFLDATSAYDTISHSGVSAACSFAGVPRDVETTILAHLGGHNRIINTAYRLGDDRTTFSLGGGLAQGAPSSPLWYLFTSAPALLYTDNILKGYNLPLMRTPQTPPVTYYFMWFFFGPGEQSCKRVFLSLHSIKEWKTSLPPTSSPYFSHIFTKKRAMGPVVKML